MELDLQNIKKVFFVGIGGIGISAIARMFLKEGKEVIGVAGAAACAVRTSSATSSRATSSLAGTATPAPTTSTSSAAAAASAAVVLRSSAPASTP
jgi:UDP-N-acetylmuramate--alanine ligase